MLQPVVRGKFTVRGKKTAAKDPEEIFSGLYGIPALLKDIQQSEEARKKEHADRLKQLEEAIAKVEKTQRGPKGDSVVPIAGVHFRQPENGKDADEKSIEERLYKRLAPQISAPRNDKDAEVDYKKLARMVARRMPKSDDPKHKAPTAKEIIASLKNLPQGERLSLDDLDNVEDKIKKFWEKYPRGYLHGGGDHVVAGNGISVTTNATGKKVIAVSGGGLSIITISGSVDDSNVNFTSMSEPLLLNVNGAFYAQTGGNITWTFSGGNITLSTPVGTGGSIFGI